MVGRGGVLDEIGELATFVMSSCLGRLLCEAAVALGRTRGPARVSPESTPGACTCLSKKCIKEEKLTVPRGKKYSELPRAGRITTSVN